MLSRRLILRGALLTGAFASFASFTPSVHAADALKVGVLIPGSKSDKGWMESSYDGLMASEKKYGDKIKVQMIENINYADMDQALTNLASKNELVIGVGGQTQAAVYKIAKRFPKVQFSIVGGNEGESAPNVAGYDVKQAEIAFVAGAAAAMLSKNGAVSYVGGLEIPSIVNAGKEFGNGAKSINANIKYFENYTGDFDDVAKSKEATLAAIAQGADIHYHILNLGLRGMEQAAKEKGTHIIGSYTDRCGSDPLYVAYSDHRHRLSRCSTRSTRPSRDRGSRATRSSVCKMGPEASGMVICGGTAEQKAKLDAIMKDIMSRQDHRAEGLSARP